MKKICLTVIFAIFYMASFAQVYYGLFEEGLPNNNTRLASIESELEKKPGLCLLFMSLPNNVDVAGCNNLVSKGITPIITLEPGTSYANINNGVYDNYFRTVADQLKQINGTVFLRYAHEMNGNWYTWDGSHNGANTAATAAYIAAWRRVYGIIKTEKGANNVLWNWCVNGGSWPNESWNQHMNYYPGDAYVDWIGFDSYDKPYNYTPYRYQSVEQTFGPVYTILANAIPDKPILVGEFASENYQHESDPHKAEFFNQAASMFEKYPRIHAFSYFNVAKSNSGRWNDYRINNPTSLLPIFKSNWISNVNVISGNSGIATLHIHKVISQTSTVRIEAENYFDQFGIKNEICSEGGLNAGAAVAGDYMDYLINVTTAGTYACNIRVASGLATGKIEIRNQSGASLASYAQSTSTGGSQTWETHTVNINLSAGKQKLRLYHSGTGLNVNWFELGPGAPPQPNNPPTVSFTSPANAAQFTTGANVQITAVASDIDPGDGISKVEFYDNSSTTPFHSENLVPYDFGWTTFTNGLHTITAKAFDMHGASSTASVSITVTAPNTPPTVSITSPANGTTAVAGTIISISATASDAAPGNISSVAFYIDGSTTALSVDNTSPYNASWTAVTGTHAIAAKATDNEGTITTSASVTISVLSASDPLTQSYFHLIDKYTGDYLRPKDGLATSLIVQDAETTVPTLSSFQWEFRASSTAGYYYIVNKYTGNAIQPTNGSIADNATLSQIGLTATNTNSTELQWTVEAVTGDPGYYWIKNRKSGLYIRPSGGSLTDLTNIVQNSLNTTYSSFRWSFVNQGSNAARGVNEMVVSETPTTIKVYPNPAVEIITVVTEVEQRSNVSISIYNISGKEFLSKDFKNMQGHFEKSFDIRGFPSGEFILQFKKGGCTELKKIIKK